MSELLAVTPEDEQTYSERYKVVRCGFWWRVKIGDGEQLVGKCYTETDAMRLASELTRAFWDGYSVGGAASAKESGMTVAGDGAKQLGALMREQRTGGPVPFA